MLVAPSYLDMANGANPNANPKCGQKINIYYNGQVTQATIFDTCPSCAEGSLDLSPSLFQAVAPNGDGRVHGVTWSYA
jgi:expansin (peptidoglycan-binding protein)